jgi:hypothetical protein
MDVHVLDRRQELSASPGTPSFGWRSRVTTGQTLGSA